LIVGGCAANSYMFLCSLANASGSYRASTHPMRNVKISPEDAVALSKHDESHFFDRKAIGVTGKSMQKHAVAFANADGGELCVGIADNKQELAAQKRWKGAANAEEFNGLLQALFEVQPTLPLTYEVLFAEGKPGYVLRVIVEKSSHVHKTADGKVYQRYGAQSLPITDPQRVVDLSFAKGASTFEDQVVPSVRAETVVESQILASFLQSYSPKTDPLDFAVNQHLLDHASWQPVCAGVLLFHEHPSAAMPRKCAVKIARYETSEEDAEREHLRQQWTIEGSLYDLIHRTMAQVSEIMSSVNIWTGEGLKSVQYPPEAIWEIVVNAIIHRDYSISDDVQILIYNNRIEILSPGRLPGYVNVDNILDARYSRNPKIVRNLNRYSDPPNKDLGEGLNTAFQKMKEWKLRDPVIVEEGNYVKVTIPHAPLATPEDAILEYLQSHDTIRNAQAREITGIRSENAVKRVFLKLKNADFIEPVPGLRGSASLWRRKK
jgi:ATP-dependent DNA helicase RecG